MSGELYKNAREKIANLRAQLAAVTEERDELRKTIASGEQMESCDCRWCVAVRRAKHRAAALQGDGQ